METVKVLHELGCDVLAAQTNGTTAGILAARCCPPQSCPLAVWDQLQFKDQLPLTRTGKERATVGGWDWLLVCGESVELMSWRAWSLVNWVERSWLKISWW